MQDKLTWALPRADGCSRYSLPVFADGTRNARASADLAGTTCWNMLKPRNVRTWRWRYQFAGWVGWTLWIKVSSFWKNISDLYIILLSTVSYRFISFQKVRICVNLWGWSLSGALIQQKMWQRGARSLILHGPPKLCEFLQECYSAGGFVHDTSKLEVAIIATHSDDFRWHQDIWRWPDDLFVSGGLYEYDVVSMPKLCGTPEHVFLVKIVENEADVPASTRSRGTKLVREHADGCFRAMASDGLPKVGVDDTVFFFVFVRSCFSSCEYHVVCFVFPLSLQSFLAWRSHGKLLPLVPGILLLSPFFFA